MQIKYIVNKALLGSNFNGMTIFPYIIIRDESLKNDKEFVNHEMIHIHQQKELFILPFFILYGLEYLYRLGQYKNAMEAYKNISFEREAYANDSNMDYLATRPKWSFLKYYSKP